MITLVANEVWRGPRPQPSDYAYIKGRFKTVISLEGTEEDHKEIVELYPVVVLSQPITFSEIYYWWAAMPTSRLERMVALVSDSPKPVLVHCQHGEDRTGLVIAAYNVRVCEWTKDRAMDEAKGFGYRWWLNYGLNKTWEEFKEKP